MAALLVLLVAVGVVHWRSQQKSELPAGFIQGNGRLEATQIDVASKMAGRLQQVLVREGDRVEAGQVLAEIEVNSLTAAIREAEAQVRRAENARNTAEALVYQRRQAEQTALAIVSQRESELAFAEKQLQRSEQLVNRGFNAPQKLDGDEAQRQSARSLLAAARSQVAEAQTGILAAVSQTIEAQSAVDAARAALERLKIDVQDAQLRAPRTARVQYRLAEPGEIIAAGGKVLSLIDLTNVSMTVYLPSSLAGRLAIGDEARLILDAAPGYVIPATISHVAAQAQFTPKSVETASERQKLVFQVKLQLDPALLNLYESRVKTGLPGIAILRLDSSQAWPARWTVKLPPLPDKPPAQPARTE